MKDYEELSRKHFDKQADKYDQTNTTYYSKEGKISCRDIADYLKDKEFKKLLDVGTGTGYLIELLIKEHDAQYYGLDLSREMIKVAKGKNIKNTEFIEGVANKLPYENESFDVVTCSQSFHHYPYQEDALSEAYRVLKKDGIYILSDTGVGGIPALIDNYIIFPLLKSGDCKTHNKNEIAKMMETTGFKIEKKYNIKRFLYTVIGRK
ncbi:MAG: class I SAM-dependent methyltransferase [Methanobrevibacter smithii]